MSEFLARVFSAEVWGYVLPATWQTIYMTAISTTITISFGLFFGILLYITDKDGLRPMPIFNKVFGASINSVLSLPSMIVVILFLPLSRVIVGASYGPKAFIVSLSIVCIPIFSRLVENSILEVAKGKVEAAKAMGASNLDIIFKVILPESLPALIRNFVVLTITLISITAIAGSFGAGGLGELAVRFGYNRYRSDILAAVIIVLLVGVEWLQLFGAFISKKILKKRRLI
ncbi:MAG: ABC transporter permease [Endomicrobium sp.]|jgi:D-methionine transport system permease protein|nr:ABC transporter permease [Endomicrobium sp.]